MNIALIGCGRLGQAMLRGWCSQGANFARYQVIDPKAKSLSGQFASAQFLDHPESLRLPLDALVIALKPSKFQEILPLYRSVIHKDILILSIAAGMGIATIEQILDCKPDSVAMVRAMPNLPASIGQGITAAYANNAVKPSHRHIAERLLQSLGQLIWIEQESDLHAITALSGSGPAYVFALCESMAKAGEKLGLDPTIAMQLAKQTIMGSGALLGADASDATALREQVTSPGGTTEAALGILQKDGALDELMLKTMQAATKRSKKLSGEK